MASTTVKDALVQLFEEVLEPLLDTRELKRNTRPLSDYVRRCARERGGRK